MAGNNATKLETIKKFVGGNITQAQMNETVDLVVMANALKVELIKGVAHIDVNMKLIGKLEMDNKAIIALLQEEIETRDGMNVTQKFDFLSALKDTLLDEEGFDR